ncbi:MAG TPA: TRIC cation channel family protein [Anaerolineales bacterium]|nr:TRIC cation channel family protein [Anaerolineales bacterium]
MGWLTYLLSYLSVGSFVIIDLIAATTNAFNGALLAQRPDYYKNRGWTVVGIILMAIFGGIGGGVTRDILINKIPSALENPWYLILCVVAGLVALLVAYDRGQRFREGFYQIMTSLSLPWYAAIGVAAGLSAGLPHIACVLLGVVGPTAGRYLIDLTAGRSAKQFVRSEWFVGTAVITSLVYLVCAAYLGLTQWPATLIAFGVGFAFRLLANIYPWEEPLPRIPEEFRGRMARRFTLKERLSKDWNPLDEFEEPS